VEAECPDCAADLSRPKAVVVSRQRRRPLVAAASAAVIVLCMAWLVAVTYSGSRATAGAMDVTRHTPTSWLAADAGGGDFRKRDAALAELARRIARGELTAAWVQALASQALDYQADWGRPWAPGWGNVIEAARTAGQLSDAQWNRYQVQAVSFTLEPEKETLHLEDALVLHLFRGPDRLSSRRPSFPLAVEPEGEVRVGGRVMAYAQEGPDPAPVLAGEAAGAGKRFASLAPIRLRRQPGRENLAAGPQRVTVQLAIRPVRADDEEPEGLIPQAPVRRVEVAGRFVLRESLDDLVTPEWKGVWAPPGQREALIRAQAKRSAGQPQRGTP
jgi:hypothetical protein